MIYTLLSDKDLKIAQKYNINPNRSVIVNTRHKNKSYVIEEHDYLDEKNKPTKYKRLTAYIIVPSQTSKSDYDKYIIATLDYSLERKNINSKFIFVGDYEFQKEQYLRQVLYFLENQAINSKASTIKIYSEDDLTSFESFEFTQSSDHIWIKENLKPHKFSNSYTELDCEIQKEIEEPERS